MHTVVTTRKASFGVVGLALLMLLLVFRPIMMGSYYVSEWKSEAPLLIACGIFLLLTGSAVVVCGLWLLGSLGRSRTALRIGGTLIVASGLVFGTASAAHVLPCSTPG